MPERESTRRMLAAFRADDTLLREIEIKRVIKLEINNILCCFMNLFSKYLHRRKKLFKFAYDISLRWKILRPAHHKVGLFFMERQRVIVYIDGFNFYYGLRKDIKWKKYYWLDIVSLFEMFMRPNQELIAVKYFSAKVDDIDKGSRQNAFFQANKENSKFKLILGKYLKKEITCYNCGNKIHTHEEKETDVRIATQIVADAYQDNCDLAIVVSADSDMIPAIELAVEAGHKVVVYFPPHQYSSNLASMASSKPIQLKRYESRFKQCLLPDKVHLLIPDYDLQIPRKWKDFQDK